MNALLKSCVYTGYSLHPKKTRQFPIFQDIGFRTRICRTDFFDNGLCCSPCITCPFRINAPVTTTKGDITVNITKSSQTMTSQTIFHRSRSLYRKACAVGYDPVVENLDYDYNYDESVRGGPQPGPRLRKKGEPYIDSFNGEPWSCSYGTAEENGTWMNSNDQAGTVMAALVWLLMIYSMVTVCLLEATNGIPGYLGMMYCLLCTMALASHAKCSLTDPGSVPRAAVPCESQRQTQTSHSMCGQCQTFKPLQSHHCRICNRCVSRMDHHCPWMNNCVGAANLSECAS